MRKIHGFSLVEILVVVAILSIVLLIAVPPTQQFVNGYRLSTSGNQLSSLIERARLHATTTQQVTALRLYADPKNKNGSQGYRIIQLLEVAQDLSNPGNPINTRPITRPFFLEPPIIISSTTSSALSNSNLHHGTGSIHGINEVAFKQVYFFPNGSTSLQSTPVNPYFTLVSIDDDTLKPSNPFVVSIDPITTRVTRFQQ